MAIKEAAVRIDLKSSGFRRGIRKATSDVQKGAKQMGGALRSSMSAGAKGGIDAIKGLFSSIKNGAKSLGAIVGGLGFAALIKGAVDADEKYRKLAFTVSAGTGTFIQARDLQVEAQKSAQKWGVANEDLADTLEEVFNTVGDLEFSRAVLDDIAKASRASGQPVLVLGKLVAEANRQFGITADQAPEALAQILSLASKGGLSVEDLGAGMGTLGSLAKVAGQEGTKGMGVMLGLVNTISAASGKPRAAISDLNAALGRLQDKATSDKFKKSFDIDLTKQGDALGRLESVLAATKGEAGALTDVFGADLGLVVARAFGEPFKEALAGAAGTESEKLEAARANFRDNLNKAATANINASDIEAQAAKNNQSAQAQIRKGLETLKAAFTKPEIIDGITKLAELIPKFADALSGIIDFITKNPLTAGAGIVAGVGAKGALTAAITAALARGGGAAAGGAAAAGGVPVTGASSAGKLFASAAFAGVAVAAAVDQFRGLMEDIGAETIGDVPKKLKAAIEQSAVDSVEQKFEALRIAEDQGFSTAEVNKAGLFGDSKTTVFADAQGRLQETSESVLKGGGSAEGFSVLADSIAATLRAETDRQSFVAGGGLIRQADTGGRGALIGADEGPDPNVAAAASAKAIAGELKSTKLQTQITNVPELASAIAKAIPTTVTPGKVPR